jgi:hypothetical protein
MKTSIIITFCIAICFIGCARPHAPVSASGVSQTSTTIDVGSDGLTTEQRNIKGRLAIDNKPGSIKHLYLVSPMNGRQVFYQTVKGKITSSGKRLTPTTVNYQYNSAANTSNEGIPVQIGDNWATTAEVIQDDGTYGSSAEYLYFWNESGQYFQVYTNGLAVIISDKPTSFQDVVIRNEVEK